MDIDTASRILSESIAKDEELIKVKRLALNLLANTFEGEFTARDEALGKLSEKEERIVDLMQSNGNLEHDLKIAREEIQTLRDEAEYAKNNNGKQDAVLPAEEIKG